MMVQTDIFIHTCRATASIFQEEPIAGGGERKRRLQNSIWILFHRVCNGGRGTLASNCVSYMNANVHILFRIKQPIVYSKWIVWRQQQQYSAAGEEDAEQKERCSAEYKRRPKSISLYSTLVRIKWAKENREATISLFLYTFLPRILFPRTRLRVCSKKREIGFIE